MWDEADLVCLNCQLMLIVSTSTTGPFLQSCSSVSSSPACTRLLICLCWGWWDSWKCIPPACLGPSEPTALPSGISIPSLKAGITHESADSASSPIRSLAVKIPNSIYPRICSWGRLLIATSCGMDFGLPITTCLAWNFSQFSIHLIICLSVNISVFWLVGYYQRLGKSSAKVKVNNIHYSSLIIESVHLTMINQSGSSGTICP